MLAKLRLDQTKTYEQCIAAYEIAKMIVAFVEGRQHIHGIGAEQGDIDGWDDFVIEQNASFFQHIQVKRQQTPFSGPTAECLKNSTKNKGDLELSPLDKSMQSLANWAKSYSDQEHIKHEFILELPDSSITIKNGLQVRNLKDFLTLHIKPATTIKGLEDLQLVAKDASAINIFNWLNTWCEFENWEHILKVLLILKTKNSGTEVDIDNLSLDKLKSVFSEADKVLRDIKSYSLENSAYTGAIAPRQLLFELKDYILPTIKTWTQFENDGSICKISGIHDLELNTEIERPSKIVQKLWENSHQRNLKINITSSNNEFSKPIGEIFQLALHCQGNCAALCLNWPSWQQTIKSKLGGTLGTGKHDCDNLNISDDSIPLKVAESKTLDTSTKQDDYATELSQEMIKATWELVKKEVTVIIQAMDTSTSSELRDKVELRWAEWKNSINIDFVKQKELLKSFLHPKAEGNRIESDLRIGPKTYCLIAEGLHLLLLVSTALSDNHQDWTKVENGLSVSTIALSFWSGPDTEKAKVSSIDDLDTVADLIGREPCEVLIISQSNLPETYLYDDTLEKGNKPSNSLASSHRPRLLITLNRIITNHIKNGLIKPFREYLIGIIENDLNSVKQSINEVIK